MKATGKTLLIAWLSCSLAVQVPLHGQERLDAAKITSRAVRKNVPSLGLPIRMDGDIDNIVRYRDFRWDGLDSPDAAPSWTMFRTKTGKESLPAALECILDLCSKWAGEKPGKPVEVVFGPFRGGWFITLCKRSRSVLGWKSLAFIIPHEGILPGSSIYTYSRSVNWVESRIGYDLYPRLPSHVREMVEEMTAAEHLCPVQESGWAEPEERESEMEYDREEDYRERG